MRQRIAIPAAVIAAASMAALPAVTAAKAPVKRPVDRDQLTINAAPNPSVAGNPLVIFGHLNGAGSANHRINLYHKVAGQHRFTFVQHVNTGADGNYVIPRADGVVTTNRDWFVTASGERGRSRIVRERVHAAITLKASDTTLQTNQRVNFYGHVDPNHRGDRVYLQVQNGSDGDDWHTIDSGRIGPRSNYSIHHRFRQADPDGKTLRVLFRGDRRNIRSESGSIDVTVNQRQNAKFTLSPSSQSIDVGQSVTLSGTLTGPHAANHGIRLWAHTYHHRYAIVASTTTDASGHYSFTVSPQHNTVYQARTNDGKRRSRQVFEGVRDTVSVSSDNASPQVGQPVTFSGKVAPSKVGHSVELQQQGSNGYWYTVESSRVRVDSSYALAHIFGAPGVKEMRVLVTGGPYNQRGVSDTVTETVSPATP